MLADLSPAYRRLARNPDNQPIFMGAFLLVFFLSGDLFALARDLSLSYLALFQG